MTRHRPILDTDMDSTARHLPYSSTWTDEYMRDLVSMHVAYSDEVLCNRITRSAAYHGPQMASLLITAQMVDRQFARELSRQANDGRIDQRVYDLIKTTCPDLEITIGDLRYGYCLAAAVYAALVAAGIISIGHPIGTDLFDATFTAALTLVVEGQR